MYQSVWTAKPVLHVLPHWNWKKGDIIDVVVYFNQADRVELYHNGKKIGDQKKDSDRYEVVFKGIAFEPGTLEVISYQQDKRVLSKTIRTAKKEQRIALIAEDDSVSAAMNELSFVHAYVVDEFGTLVPDAANNIDFEVEGDGAKILATDNGNTTDHTRFQSTSRRAFHGKVLVIVSSKNKGQIVVKAKSKGLISGEVHIKVE